MSFKIIATLRFAKDLKRLIRKYPSLKNEYAQLVASLKRNPIQGTPIGRSCYKIRLAVASKGKGKSGGARVITLLVLDDAVLFLVAIYDKSAKKHIADKALQDLLRHVSISM